jgi:hypothetical protein
MARAANGGKMGRENKRAGAADLLFFTICW